MTDEEAEKQQDAHEEQVRKWEQQADRLARKLIKEIDEPVYDLVLRAIVEYETTTIEDGFKDFYPEHLVLISSLLYAIYEHAKKSSELRSTVIHIASRLIPEEPISDLVQ